MKKLILPSSTKVKRLMKLLVFYDLKNEHETLVLSFFSDLGLVH